MTRRDRLKPPCLGGEERDVIDFKYNTRAPSRRNSSTRFRHFLRCAETRVVRGDSWDGPSRSPDCGSL